MGDQDGILGSWFQPGPAPAAVDIWEQISRWVISLCVSVSLFSHHPVSVFQMKKRFKKKKKTARQLINDGKWEPSPAAGDVKGPQLPKGVPCAQHHEASVLGTPSAWPVNRGMLPLVTHTCSAHWAGACTLTLLLGNLQHSANSESWSRRGQSGPSSLSQTPAAAC